MDITLVTRKLLAGEYKIRSVSSGKSTVWNRFGLVIDSDSSDLDYVACKQCNHVLSYKGRQTGTTSMTKHKCKVSSTQTILTPVVKTIKSKSSCLSKTKKDAMTSACVDFVCKDIRPFDTVSGTGFIQVIQEVSSGLCHLSVLDNRSNIIRNCCTYFISPNLNRALS